MTDTVTDSVNRVLWTLLGLLLAAGGVLGAVASRGALAGTDPDSPLLWSWSLASWRDAGTAAPLGTAGVGLVVAVLGFVLLRAQLPARRPTPPTLRVGNPDDRGTTEIRGGALPGALADDLRRLVAVRGAQVTLSGPTEATRVRVRLDVLPEITVARLAAAVQQCLDRFATTTGLRVGEVEVTLRLQEPAPGRHLE